MSGNDLGKSGDPFGTESGTVQDETGTLPPDLAMVVNAWAALSNAARKEILKVVRREASTEAAN